jgi:hypothetical protein
LLARARTPFFVQTGSAGRALRNRPHDNNSFTCLTTALVKINCAIAVNLNCGLIYFMVHCDDLPAVVCDAIKTNVDAHSELQM